MSIPPQSKHRSVLGRNIFCDFFLRGKRIVERSGILEDCTRGWNQSCLTQGADKESAYFAMWPLTTWERWAAY